MAVGSYYPKTLRVPCPTHGPRRFEMDLEREAYVCPDRDNPKAVQWDTPVRQLEGGMLTSIRPRGPVRGQHVGYAMGGCLWVVLLETLLHNPDGSDPVRMANRLEFKL